MVDIAFSPDGTVVAVQHMFQEIVLNIFKPAHEETPLSKVSIRKKNQGRIRRRTLTHL